MANLHVWDTEYKTVTPSARTLKDWIGAGPVGIVVRDAVADDDGTTKAVKVTVVESDGTATDVTVTVVRVIRQLATLGKVGADRTVAEVAAYGRRGYVLAPPARKVPAELEKATNAA